MKHMLLVAFLLTSACDVSAWAPPPPKNKAPVATPQSIVTAYNTKTTITLSATDADGDSLLYFVVTNPSHGAVLVTGATATYTPTLNYSGSDSFTFKANDGKDDSNVATVSITVSAEIPPPPPPPPTNKPYATGIYNLTPSGVPDLTTYSGLTNANVSGFRLRIGWNDIQPTSASAYNWTALDKAFSDAAAHGKKIGIGIAAGLTTPDWVYTSSPTVYKYAFKELDNHGNSIGNMPLPWDLNYQAKWTTFIKAVAARYESSPTLSYIITAGFMQINGMAMAKTTDDESAMDALAVTPPKGFTGLTTSFADAASAYTPAAESLLSMEVEAFKTTPSMLTIEPVFPSDKGKTSETAVKNYGLNKYPGRFGTFVSALFATLTHGAYTKVNYPKGFQMVWLTGDPTRSVYVAPPPVPEPAQPKPLFDALEHGLELGGQFVEVYTVDINNSVNQGTLTTESTKFKANIP